MVSAVSGVSTMVPITATQTTRGHIHQYVARLCMKKGNISVHAAAQFVACLPVWLNSDTSTEVTVSVRPDKLH